MKRRGVLCYVIITILLIIGNGRVAMAQTSEEPGLTGYFVNVNWQPAGPFDTTGLRQLIHDGQLTRDTLVWKEGMNDWTVAGTITELAPLFLSAPPPLPGGPPPLTQALPPVPATPPPILPPPPPPQPASINVQGEPWGGNPWTAGYVNAIFGIWSFSNNDFFGGFLTAGLQVSGVALSIIGTSLYRSWILEGGNYGTAQAVYLVGYGMVAAGTIYGFFRGFTQYNRKMAVARSFAEAINDNPLNNITLVAFPTFDEKRFAGILNYSLSF